MALIEPFGENEQTLIAFGVGKGDGVFRVVVDAPIASVVRILKGES